MNNDLTLIQCEQERENEKTDINTDNVVGSIDESIDRAITRDVMARNGTHEGYKTQWGHLKR